MKNKLVLIDGHSMLFRAFHGMPPMNTADGTPTNAIFGFLRILFKIIDEEQPTHLAVAFDTSAPTFRHKMYDAYKGTRKPAPDEFKVQEPIMRQIIEAMDIPIYCMAGWEADDILGTLARKGDAAGYDVRIISGDHDLLQIADENIAIVIPSTRGGKTDTTTYFAKDVLEQYEVTPKQFIDVKALMGDTSDNIPGLPGVGKVTATKLIKTYGCIENAHDHQDELKGKKLIEAMRDHYDLAVLSKELATISTEAPVELDADKLVANNIYTEEAYNIFKNMGFKSFYDRFEISEEQKPSSIDLEIIEKKKDF
ncbi:MAG: DNA polymerase I, partial [Lachnospiraceae bacterium]|nr:DNA polymerase I [Candidatus Equihabitans merdae]